MIRELLDELLSDHTGCAEYAYVDSCVVHDVLVKKKPAGLEGPAGVGTVLCLLSYATIAHTPGLRIRFVRFRVASMCVVVSVTIVAQYTGCERVASNSRFGLPRSVRELGGRYWTGALQIPDPGSRTPDPGSF